MDGVKRVGTKVSPVVYQYRTSHTKLSMTTLSVWMTKVRNDLTVNVGTRRKTHVKYVPVTTKMTLAAKLKNVLKDQCVHSGRGWLSNKQINVAKRTDALNETAMKRSAFWLQPANFTRR